MENIRIEEVSCCKWNKETKRFDHWRELVTYQLIPKPTNIRKQAIPLMVWRVVKRESMEDQPYK